MSLSPYGFTEVFESTLAKACITSRRAWLSIGQHLRSESLGYQPAKIIVMAALAIYHDTDEPPVDENIVCQRIMTWVEERKYNIGYEDVQNIGHLLETTKVPDDLTMLLAEAAATLKLVERKRFCDAAINAVSDPNLFSLLIEEIDRIGDIGRFTESSTWSLHTDGIASLLEPDTTRRLLTSVPDIDAALDGGIPVSTLTLFIGAPGAGKSMMMSQMAAYYLRERLNVGYITLEVPEKEVKARILAPAYGGGLTVRDFGTPSKAAAIEKAHNKMISHLGELKTARMPAHTTTVSAIKKWFLANGPFDVHIVDYIDLVSRHADEDSTESTYQTGGYVTKSLREFAEETNSWLITASQAVRRSANTKVALRLDDVADSMHKVRIADIVVGLNYKNGDDGVSVEVGILKNRYGRSGDHLGPYTPMFELGLAIPSLNFLPTGHKTDKVIFL